MPLVKILDIGSHCGWDCEEYRRGEWKVGSIIDLSSPDFYTNHNLAIKVDDQGNEINPAPELPTESGLTISGRIYYDKTFKKFGSDPNKLVEHFNAEEKDLLDSLARLMLLKTSYQLAGTRRRCEFLDREGRQFLKLSREKVRQEFADFIDDTVFRVNKLPIRP